MLASITAKLGVAAGLPSAAMAQYIKECKKMLFVEKPSPVAAAKAVKNPAELAGMREAHLRDAVALAETLHHLEQEVRKLSARRLCLPYLLTPVRSSVLHRSLTRPQLIE